MINPHSIFSLIFSSFSFFWLPIPFPLLLRHPLLGFQLLLGSLCTFVCLVCSYSWWLFYNPHSLVFLSKHNRVPSPCFLFTCSPVWHIQAVRTTPCWVVMVACLGSGAWVASMCLWALCTSVCGWCSAPCCHVTESGICSRWCHLWSPFAMALFAGSIETHRHHDQIHLCQQRGAIRRQQGGPIVKWKLVNATGWHHLPHPLSIMATI